MHFLFLLIFALASCYASGFIFDSNLTGVWLDYALFPEDVDYPNVYDKPDWIQIVSTISSRFNKITFNYDPSGSTALIPSAIAEFNKLHRTQDQPFVDAIIFHEYDPDEGTESSTTSKITKIATEANKISEGTVKTLVVFVNNLTSENIIGLKKSLENSRRGRDNSTFKIGVSFLFPECTKNSSYLQEIINLSDLVVFQNLAKSDFHRDFDHDMEKIQKDLENCKNIVYSLKTDINLEFLVGRSSMLPDGSQNSSVLISFWEEMNQWAIESKTRLIFYNAIDAFIDDDNPIPVGWWKAIRTDNGSHYILKEKISLLAGNSTKDGNPANPSSQKFKGFSDTKTWVIFSPWVVPKEEGIDEKSLFQMVDLISTRFSQVMLNPLEQSDLENENNETLIPSVIAKWNKLYSPSKTLFKVNMLYNLNPLETNMTSFNVAKQLADKANKIFPGTVTSLSLTLGNRQLNEENASLAKTVLENARKTLKTELTFDYKLGAVFRLVDCDNMITNVSKPNKVNLTQILGHLDEVYFNKSASVEERRAGVGKSFSGIVKTYEQCLEKFSAGKNITTSLITSWPDTNEKTGQNWALVTFWERLNEWAVARNANIVLGSAFDNNFEYNSDSSGWWRLDPTKKYKKPFKFSFQEKAHVVNMDIEFSTLVTFIGYEQILIGVSSLFSFLFVVVLFMKCWDEYRRKK